MEIRDGGAGELPAEPKKRGRKPGQRKRTPLEMQRDRAEIEKLRLRYRMSIYDISDRINSFYADEIPEEGKLAPHLSYDQVKTELYKAAQEYNNNAMETIQDKRKELIRAYWDLYQYAQERYEVSCTDKVTKTVEAITNKERGDTDKIKEATVNTDGNPTYLMLKEICLRRIGELEAAFPPKTTTLVGVDGNNVFKFEGAEEFKRLEALAKELLPKMVDEKRFLEAKVVK